jgi:hypothetical protein
MKRAISIAVLGVMLSLSVRPVLAAPDEYDGTQAHPLRVAGYLVHPIGFTLEWLFFRPFHYVVSRPGLDQFFGHRPHGDTRAY